MERARNSVSGGCETQGNFGSLFPSLPTKLMHLRRVCMQQRYKQLRMESGSVPFVMDWLMGETTRRVIWPNQRARAREERSFAFPPWHRRRGPRSHTLSLSQKCLCSLSSILRPGRDTRSMSFVHQPTLLPTYVMHTYMHTITHTNKQISCTDRERH